MTTKYEIKGSLFIIIHAKIVTLSTKLWLNKNVLKVKRNNVRLELLTLSIIT